jgi:hypothetical protein
MISAIVVALACGGCLASNLAEALKAAGDDQATVSVNVKTIYGTIQYCRTAILNGNVACDSNGITVKSDGATVGIPMTITPQFTIKQGNQ